MENPNETIQEVRTLLARATRLLANVDLSVSALKEKSREHILSVITKEGKKGIQAHKLLAATHRIDRTMRDEILQDLIDASIVVCCKIPSISGRGRPSYSYFAVEFLEQESQSE